MRSEEEIECISRVEEATTVSISLCFVVNKYTLYGYMEIAFYNFFRTMGASVIIPTV
jgi:hypothetical protein